MTDTFDWRVHANSAGQGGFVTNKVQFGDGYSQSTPQGINNETGRWNISVAGYASEVQPIVDFIRAKKGAESFFWTPPLTPTGYYECVDYTITPNGGAHYTISAVFELVHRP